MNLLFRAFISGNVLILTRAYITYVRPILEYCTYIWSPFQIYLIEKIERVQRYFSRRVLRQTKLNYHDRLHVLNLESLELRRIKWDIKLCYKIVRGLCDLDCNDFLLLHIIQTLEVIILNFLDPSAKITGFLIFLRIVLFLTGTFYLLRLSMQNPSEHLMLN